MQAPATIGSGYESQMVINRWYAWNSRFLRAYAVCADLTKTSRRRLNVWPCTLHNQDHWNFAAIHCAWLSTQSVYRIVAVQRCVVGCLLVFISQSLFRCILCQNDFRLTLLTLSAKHPNVISISSFALLNVNIYLIRHLISITNKQNDPAFFPFLFEAIRHSIYLSLSALHVLWCIVLAFSHCTLGWNLHSIWSLLRSSLIQRRNPTYHSKAKNTRFRFSISFNAYEQLSEIDTLHIKLDMCSCYKRKQASTQRKRSMQTKIIAMFTFLQTTNDNLMPAPVSIQ